MSLPRLLRRLPALLGLVLLTTSTLQAQVRVREAPQSQGLDPAVAFLKPFGIANFSTHYVAALSALLRGEKAFRRGDMAGAKAILDELWNSYPVGSTSWAQLPTQPFGINLGSPPCYYGLRMLTDTVDFHLANPGTSGGERSAQLTVVLVGKSHGIEPRNLAELQSGGGIPVQHALEPSLLNNGSRAVHRSLRLFRQYVLAATQGKLELRTRILHLPDTDLEVRASANGSSYFAGLTDTGELWPDVSAAEMADTDWWWVVYPSHVPEQYPAFQNAEFITGGMGTGPDSLSPMFLIDDRWLVRKPPHLGDGPYTPTERETYLPQWLQHEWYHHLYRTFPEFGLETTSHQWFNRSTWPPDFVGRYEPDYYHESLYKRLQGALPPMVSRLRYATGEFDWSTIGLTGLFGVYQRNPVQNAWHQGTIQQAPVLEWLNQAGVSWNLYDELANGRLATGPDCPYFGTWAGNAFRLVPERDLLGDILNDIAGFAFNGELYEFVWP